MTLRSKVTGSSSDKNGFTQASLESNAFGTVGFLIPRGGGLSRGKLPARKGAAFSRFVLVNFCGVIIIKRELNAALLTVILGTGFHSKNGFARFHEIQLIARQ
jgi:hypothetical protein